MGLYGPFSDHVPIMHYWGDNSIRLESGIIAAMICSIQWVENSGGGVIASELVPMTAGVIG